MTSELIPTAAELKLIEAAAKGIAADYRAVGAPQDDWQHNRDESKTLRAEIVRALILRMEPAWPVAGTALRIVGARITGRPESHRNRDRLFAELRGVLFRGIDGTNGREGPVAMSVRLRGGENRGARARVELGYCI